MFLERTYKQQRKQQRKRDERVAARLRSRKEEAQKKEQLFQRFEEFRRAYLTRGKVCLRELRTMCRDYGVATGVDLATVVDKSGASGLFPEGTRLSQLKLTFGQFSTGMQRATKAVAKENQGAPSLSLSAATAAQGVPGRRAPLLGPQQPLGAPTRGLQIRQLVARQEVPVHFAVGMGALGEPRQHGSWQPPAHKPRKPQFMGALSAMHAGGADRAEADREKKRAYARELDEQVRQRQHQREIEKRRREELERKEEKRIARDQQQLREEAVREHSQQGSGGEGGGSGGGGVFNGSGAGAARMRQDQLSDAMAAANRTKNMASNLIFGVNGGPRSPAPDHQWPIEIVDAGAPEPPQRHRQRRAPGPPSRPHGTRMNGEPEEARVNRERQMGSQVFLGASTAAGPPGGTGRMNGEPEEAARNRKRQMGSAGVQFGDGRGNSGGLGGAAVGNEDGNFSRFRFEQAPHHVQQEMLRRQRQQEATKRALADQVEEQRRRKAAAKQRERERERYENEKVERQRRELADQYLREKAKKAAVAPDDLQAQGAMGTGPMGRAPPPSQQHHPTHQGHEEAGRGVPPPPPNAPAESAGRDLTEYELERVRKGIAPSRRARPTRRSPSPTSASFTPAYSSPPQQQHHGAHQGMLDARRADVARLRDKVEFVRREGDALETELRIRKVSGARDRGGKQPPRARILEQSMAGISELVPFDDGAARVGAVEAESSHELSSLSKSPISARKRKKKVCVRLGGLFGGPLKARDGFGPGVSAAHASPNNPLLDDPFDDVLSDFLNKKGDWAIGGIG